MKFVQKPLKTQKQALMLSSGVFQSLELLKMPLLDLRKRVILEASTNPLLDIDESSDDMVISMPSMEYIEDDRDCPPWDNEASDKIIKRDPLYSMCSTGKTNRSLSADFLSVASKGPTFHDLLIEQLGELKIDPSLAAICRYIIGSLNERGYLDDPIEEIASTIKMPISSVSQALCIVQGLQPTGVGARTVEECLMLQLIERKALNAQTLKIIQEGLRYLAQNNIAAIARILKSDVMTTQHACETIRSLNPIPSQGYNTNNQTVLIIPDAIIHMEDDFFVIEMTESVVPKLSINKDYYFMLQKSDDVLGKKYLRNSLSSAKQLIRGINDRAITLYSIIETIVIIQSKYFKTGKELMPMTMQDIAEKLTLSISTISRAVQGKFIACHAGTIPLKSLFTIGITAQDGGANSSYNIKQTIKELIDKENPKMPLSDEVIHHALAAANIPISRRTVAKYRTELGIQSSSRRKTFTAPIIHNHNS